MQNFLNALYNTSIDVLGIGLTIITPWIIQRVDEALHVQAGSAAANDLAAGLQHAIGLIQSELHTVKNMTDEQHTDVAVSNAASLVMKLAPNAEKHLGVTHEAIKNLIRAKMNDVTK